MSITKTPLPYAFTDGTVAYGSQVDTNFDAVWLDKDAVIDVVNEITAGTTAVPKATHAVNADNATTAVNAQTANNAANSDTLDGSHKADIITEASSPAGAVTAFAGGTAPTGWLECNGAAVSRTTYAALFGAIGVTYGSGDGISTFNLPDLRGEFLRGWSHGKTGVDEGRTLGSSQGDQLQTHEHAVWNPLHSTWATVTNDGPTSVDTAYQDTIADPGDSTITANVLRAKDLTVGNSGTETRPRNIAMMYIIKH